MRPRQNGRSVTSSDVVYGQRSLGTGAYPWMQSSGVSDWSPVGYAAASQNCLSGVSVARDRVFASRSPYRTRATSTSVENLNGFRQLRITLDNTRIGLRRRRRAPASLIGRRLDLATARGTRPVRCASVVLMAVRRARGD